MKSLVQFIHESLVSKSFQKQSSSEENAEWWSYVDFKDLNEEIHNAFKQSGYRLEQKGKYDNVINDPHINDIVYVMGTSKDYIVQYKFSVVKETEEHPGLTMYIYVKNSKSVRNKTKKQVFFSIVAYLQCEESSTFPWTTEVENYDWHKVKFSEDLSHPKREYYTCYPECADSIIEGIKKLKDRDTLFNISFDTANPKKWYNNVIQIVDEIFKEKQSNESTKNYPWNN